MVGRAAAAGTHRAVTASQSRDLRNVAHTFDRPKWDSPTPTRPKDRRAERASPKPSGRGFAYRSTLTTAGEPSEEVSIVKSMFRFALVLTGVTTLAEVPTDPAPAFVVPDLASLVDRLR